MFNIWCLVVVSVETDSTCTRDCLSWLVKPVVILWIWGGKNADSLKEEHTASLILAQIKGELMDNGDFQGLDSYDIARRLAMIIDAYTPL